MNTWYSQWFNKLYLRLYSRHDAGEAQQQVRFLLSNLTEREKITALDVACGTGRHVEALRSAGLLAYGVDRSLELLSHGIGAATTNQYFTCADMRSLPFAQQSFDLLTSFFTSFGYFETDEEHAALLSEWSRVLRSGGSLFIDYLNPSYVRKTLVPESERQEGNLRIREERRITSDERRVVKQIFIFDSSNNREFTYTESVRLYSQAQLRDLLNGADFALATSFGDFAGGTFSSTSPRMLLLAEKR